MPLRNILLGLQLLRTIRLPAVFSFQKIRYPAPDKASAGDSGVLNFIPAIIAGLSPLADLPELTPQAFRTVVQTAPEELFGN